MLRYAKYEDKWLGRVDKNPTPSNDEWLKHVEAEYGLTGVVAVETNDNTDPRVGVLVMPPEKPVVVRPPTLEERLATVEAKLKALERV